MESNKFKVGDRVKCTQERGVDFGTVRRIIDEDTVEIICKDEYSDRIFIALTKHLELFQLPKIFCEGLGCIHNWIDVGFNFTKEVCSKCNEER